MPWSPTPTVPAQSYKRAWFPEPPDPVDPAHHPYWRPYYEAVLSGRLQPLTAALTGTHGQDAVLAASLRPLAAALTGQHSTEGQIAAALQALRFAGSNIITSDLAGSLQPLRASLVGEQALVGTLAGSLPALRASISAEQIITGQLTGGLQPLRAALAGSQAHVGQLGAQLRPLTATLTGMQSQTGTLAAALRALLFSGLGTHTQSGVMSGGLRPLSAALAGSVKNAVVLDNTADAGYVPGISGSGQSKTFAYTNYGNCIVVFHTNTTSSTSVTCTYGGVTIPRVYGPTSGGTVFLYTSYCQIFMLISNSLPQGTNNVVINNTSQTAVYGVASFKNAGSLSVSSDTSSGNINKSSVPGDGNAAVAGYVGVVTFGTVSPNQILNYPFNAFNSWASVMAYGLDTGSGITFTDPSHIGSKAGAVVTISPP